MELKGAYKVSTRYKLGWVALLLVGMGYLGLVLFLGTFTPFLLVHGTSMEPTFHAGDLLLNKRPPEAEIKVGEVIAFDVPPDALGELNFPHLVTHRVIGMELSKGQMVFITQGDNNKVVDPYQVPPNLVRGVVLKNLGPVGRPLLFFTNKKAVVVEPRPSLLGVPLWQLSPLLVIALLLAYLGIKLLLKLLNEGLRSKCRAKS